MVIFQYRREPAMWPYGDDEFFELKIDYTTENNVSVKDYGEYRIGKALVDGDKELSAEGSFIQITAEQLGELGGGAHMIEVELV
jgi:hypothetical protein